MAEDISSPGSNSTSGISGTGAGSEPARKTAEGSGGNDRSAELAANLKEFGIDTDRMAQAANEHASDLQRMMTDEIRTRPMRAVGWAAAAGFVIGLLWAR